LSNGGSDDEYVDAKHLAARAYLKASYTVPGRNPREAYRMMASNVLSVQTVPRGHTPIPLAEVEKDFGKELSEAREWYASVKQNEQKWIAEGKDPEREFARTYYEAPDEEEAPWPRTSGPLLAVAAGAVGLLGLGLLVWKRGKRKAPAAA
jgi:hypothetical protein